jgi:uncharacterized protein
MTAARIAIPHAQIAAFCHRWKITELALFGSVLRDDFRPDSDIDVLVTFEADDPWTFGHLLDMKDELERILRRNVDLVERRAIEQQANPWSRGHILSTAEVIYAA